MPKVQMFRVATAKVKGPMGVYQEERLTPSGAQGVNHDGKDYEAGDDGWIELPNAAYEALKGMRHKHPHGGYTRWFTPAEVDEQVRLDLVDGLAKAEPARRAPGRPRKDAE